MAFHTKKDFAALCMIPTNALSVYIKRGKVIVKNELISDSVTENAEFLKKMQAKGPSSAFISSNLSEKSAEIPAETPQKQQPQALKKEKTNKDFLENDPQSPVSGSTDRSGLSNWQLERERLLADIAKKEVDTRIAVLKEEKMLGANIPTDLVKGVVANLTKTFIASFKDGADFFIIEISKRKSLSAQESAELKGRLVEIINSASNKAINDTRKNLTIIIDQASVKKEVGEHD